MRLRYLLVVGLLGVVSASFASFEMMLMAGYGGIHRYDPQNNVVLGKFGTLDGVHWDVALDPTRPGEVVSVSDYGAINRYDYSTGEFRGGFTIATLQIYEVPKISVMTNGNILVSAYTQADGRPVTRMYSPTGALLVTLAQFGSTYHTLDSIQSDSRNLHTLVRNGTGNNVDYYLLNYTSAGVYTGITSIFANSNSTSLYGSLGIVNGNIVASSGQGFLGPNRLAMFNSGSAASPTSITVSNTVSEFGGSNYVGGHNGYGYMIHSYNLGTTPTNRMIRYNPNFNSALSTNVIIPINDTLLGSAIVVAPEPGTMIALGLGLAALVRRRKSAAV